MQNIAIQRASQLPADIREAVEKTLGRALREDEEVSIMALSPHPAPSAETRRVLARRLEERLDKTADRTKDVPDEELEAAIDEALNNARPRPR